jgi:hypothetical protein
MASDALARIERLNYVIAAIAVAFGAIVLGQPYAIGLGVGALVASLNFSVIRHLVERWTAAAPSRKGGTAFLFVPKMAALIVVVFVAIRYLPLSPPAFAIGFSTFLISIAIESFRFVSRGAAASE